MNRDVISSCVQTQLLCPLISTADIEHSVNQAPNAATLPRLAGRREGFEHIARERPDTTVQCPVDFLAPFNRCSGGQGTGGAGGVSKLGDQSILDELAVSRSEWHKRTRSIRRARAMGYDVNL